MPESQHLLACRTLPGAPKVIWGRRGTRVPAVRKRYLGVYPGRPARGILERLMDVSQLWNGTREVSEEFLEIDPDMPASTVRLSEHPHGVDWCREQVRQWREAGFLPVAVSRLVGLCVRDCELLTDWKPARAEERGRGPEENNYDFDT